MAAVELVMPKMGESIIEATVLSWSKSVGDPVAVDETVLEIATDKVDSEVPSPVAGTLAEIRFAPDDVVPVGEVIAVIETPDVEGAGAPTQPATPAAPADAPPPDAAPEAEVMAAVAAPAPATSGGGAVSRVGAKRASSRGSTSRVTRSRISRGTPGSAT